MSKTTQAKKPLSQLVITTKLVRTAIPNLTGPEKAVLIYLSALIGLDNNHPSEKTIARCTGFCLNTIKNVIKALASKGYISVKSISSKLGRRNLYEVKPEKWMGGEPKSGPMGEPKNGLMGEPKNGPIIDTLQSVGIERPPEVITSTSLQAGKQAAPTPTAEPTHPVAKGAQHSPDGSLADGAKPLAPSATPTKPPFVYRRPTSNTNYCEDTDLYRSSLKQPIAV